MSTVLITGSGITSFRVGLGDGAATETWADGWMEVERERRSPLTEYGGPRLWRVSIPLMIDGWDTERDVQPELNRIKALAGRVFRVHGPIPRSGADVVLANLTEGTALRSSDGMALLRQELTLEVLQYSPPQRIKFVRRPPTYTTVEGDSINRIAVKVYGDRTLAKALGDMNGIKDRTRKIKKGKQLKLPAPPRPLVVKMRG